MYYYHPDHLGSSSYITDKNSEIIQHTEYIAFGETFVDEHSTSNKQPYLFNGKELDMETGLYYYGARYYDAKVSLWLNTDPLSGYNPILETEHYIDGQHNGGVFNFGNLNTYTYTYQNPIKWIDPNGKQAIAIHGTWSSKDTWEQKNAIRNVAIKAFGNKEYDFNFEWSGYNTSTARTIASSQLISYIKNIRKNIDINEPLTLIGHSHGGNVAIEAINTIIQSEPELSKLNINLITINTPVRNDYQLSDEAQNKTKHLNVYDPKDPVQSRGGGNYMIGNGKYKPTGEQGKAGRVFNTPNTKNIQVKHPQGITDDFHNSHNRVKDWYSEIK